MVEHSPKILASEDNATTTTNAEEVLMGVGGGGGWMVEIPGGGAGERQVVYLPNATKAVTARMILHRLSDKRCHPPPFVFCFVFVFVVAVVSLVVEGGSLWTVHKPGLW